MSDFEALEGDEKLQVTAWLSAYTAHAGTTLASSEAGSLEPSIAEVTLGFLASLLRTPGGGQWWAASKAFFSSWLTDAIDGAREGEGYAITEVAPWWGSDVQPAEQA